MKIKKTIFLAVLFFGYFVVAKNSWAAEIQAASCNQADVQAAINMAQSGDTVKVPAGECVWNSGITIVKGIIFRGAGIDNTIVTMNLASGNMIEVHTVSSDSIISRVRIVGFTFRNNYIFPNQSIFYISVRGGIDNSLFRIDNNKFIGGGDGCNTSNPAYIMAHAIQVSNGNAGLIDNNFFEMAANSEDIHNYGNSFDTADPDWTNDVDQARQLFVEDNVFKNSCLMYLGGTYYFVGNSAIQNYYGAKTTFRHNTLTMSHFDAHGNGGLRGTRWYEIYDNSFNIVANGNQDATIALRGGSGVVFDNRLNIEGGGAGGGIKLQEEDCSLYPCVDQIGHGKNQILDPLYIWNNSVNIAVYNQNESVIMQDRDYYVLAKSGYIPYVYPHPLRNEGDTILPFAPSGLSVR